MNIIKNTSVREKYHYGFKRNNDITEIIIHGTGGGKNAESLINWMLSGEREKEYLRGIALFHYLIDYDGTIYEIIDTDNWVYHSSSGQHDKYTIGIEHMNHDKKNNGIYTEQQSQSSNNLILYLLKKYPTINKISGHGVTKLQYSHTYKNCPGPNFNWEKLSSELGKNGYLYSDKTEMIDNIKPGPQVGVRFL